MKTELLKEAIQNALYATNRFATLECEELTDGIMIYVSEIESETPQPENHYQKSLHLADEYVKENPQPEPNDCNCSDSELLVEYSGGDSRCKWCGKKMKQPEQTFANSIDKSITIIGIADEMFGDKQPEPVKDENDFYVKPPEGKTIATYRKAEPVQEVKSKSFAERINPDHCESPTSYWAIEKIINGTPNWWRGVRGIGFSTDIHKCEKYTSKTNAEFDIIEHELQDVIATEHMDIDLPVKKVKPTAEQVLFDAYGCKDIEELNHNFTLSVKTITDAMETFANQSKPVIDYEQIASKVFYNWLEEFLKYQIESK